MKQPESLMYDINRKVYNEEEFQQEHDQRFLSQIDEDFVAPQAKRRIQCRFSWERFRKIMLNMFPILNWMCSYHITEWVLGDVHAGISVGMVQMLQGLLTLQLTGLQLPITNVFYSAFFSTLTYVIFGTSHHISIGSFTILNAMIANFQKALNFNVTLPRNATLIMSENSVKMYTEALALTASTTFLVGIIQILLCFICLGYVTTYLSETLMNAYLTAAALHVIVSQFSFIFGIVIDFHSGPLAIFYNMVNYCMGIPKANSTSILLFFLTVVMLWVSRCIKITYKHSPVEFPMELLLIIMCTIISTKIQWHAESSMGILTTVPSSFLSPTLPDFPKLYKIILHALSLAVVSYFLLIFVGKKYATIHNYHVRHTQELLAIGLCNVFGSFFKSFVVSCAVSATVIQEKTGGKTQLAALIGASIMLVTVLKLGKHFQYLPNAVLAAIVIFNMLPFLEKFIDVPCLWKQDKYDFGIWIVTFLAVLCLGLDIGLVIAMGFAFFIISVRSHRMKMLILGQIPNTQNIYRSFSDYDEATEIQGVRIFQCCSSISSANMKQFKNYVLRKMDMKAVPLDENEMRALISVSLSSVNAPTQDLQCACVCNPPEPLPRVPYTEKLVRRLQTSTTSSSSSFALVRLRRARTRSITQLSPCDSESATYPIHTIILDFSMVHFVDLQASYLLRELCHVFQNIGITVLIAACHSTVIKSFERNGFFDQYITKARFFPTLHDAVLFAVDSDPLQEMLPVDPSTAQNEDVSHETGIDNHEDRSQQSARSQHSDRMSQQSAGNRTPLMTTVHSGSNDDEPITDLYRTSSFQSEGDTVPLPHLQRPHRNEKYRV
ncbi:testis anion transporter 1 [Heteronotia binoei]|uniref:testis anion transporter 1 n=1 Tax=Heteronotia binoei TaxID=13085 RepID=UPI00292F90B6|nr:testis anion transporter 1 [Heteronotia binoei]